MMENEENIMLVEDYISVDAELDVVKILVPENPRRRKEP